MISPPFFSARASASSDLPDAVGPTTRATSASVRSISSTSNLALQFVPANAGDDRPAMWAVAGEVDFVERGEQCRCLDGGKPIAGSDRAVAGHGGEHEIHGVGEGAAAGASQLGDEIAHHAFRFDAR